MTPFRRLDAMASRAVDRLNARPFIHTPMIAVPNGRRLRDMERPVSEGRGILTDQAASTPIAIGNRRAGSDQNDLRTLAAGRKISLSVDRGAHPDLVARQGDAIEIGERVFAVALVRPDGMARTVLILEEQI